MVLSAINSCHPAPLTLAPNISSAQENPVHGSPATPNSPSWEHPQTSPCSFTCAATYAVHSFFFQILKAPLHRWCPQKNLIPKITTLIQAGIISHSAPPPKCPFTFLSHSTPPPCPLALPLPSHSRHTSLSCSHHSLSYTSFPKPLFQLRTWKP